MAALLVPRVRPLGKNLGPLRIETQTLVERPNIFSIKYSKSHKRTLIIYFNGLLSRAPEIFILVKMLEPTFLGNLPNLEIPARACGPLATLQNLSDDYGGNDSVGRITTAPAVSVSGATASPPSSPWAMCSGLRECN